MLIRLPDDMSTRLAAAIRNAVKDSGQPIVLSNEELAAFFPDFLTVEMVEKVATDESVILRAFSELRSTDGWGSCPRFEKGKWAL